MTAYASVAALAAGFVLDLLFGDPHDFPHIVRAIGRLISLCEKKLRPLFPASRRGEFFSGALLVFVVVSICTVLPALILHALYRVFVPIGFCVETFICAQLFSTRALRDESMKVHDVLKSGDLSSARRALSMIVGRDTENLDEIGVIKATIETVAENTAAGTVGQLFWMGLFGTAGGCFCKAVNTTDSMIGYKNARYRSFGCPAARLDDAVNFLPARAAGLLMVAAAWLNGFNARGAWQIFRRDRLAHQSPNSAHTEAACAGSLGIQLGGPASYEGKIEEKPTLGDPTREVEIEDIRRANDLMMTTSLLAFFAALALRIFIIKI